MIGPFKKAQWGYTHILVAIDKFTKSMEFIQEIMFRFGIPKSIITNMGSNFTSSEFFDFCEQRNI